MKKLVKYMALQDLRTPKRLLESLKRQEENISEILPNVLNSLSEKLHKRKRVVPNKLKFNKHLSIKISKNIEDGADYGVLKVKTPVGRKPWFN
ncbi:MAG: hypothetical protein R3F25_02575 [Gammaproteobacteria bacterium]|jgi:hypothetical protein|nr:hypothetical protein [Xanthomonadales bacterium]